MQSLILATQVPENLNASSKRVRFSPTPKEAPGQPCPVAADAAGLDPAARRARSVQLDRSLHACGCSEGAAGLLLALAAMVVAMLADAFWLPDAGWQLALLGVGCAATGAVVGKILGKTRGRYRARRLMALLAERSA